MNKVKVYRTIKLRQLCNYLAKSTVSFTFSNIFYKFAIAEAPKSNVMGTSLEDGIASLTHYLDSMIKVRLQVGKNNEEKV